MRIGIDARFYGSWGKGLGRYTQKLIAYLEKIDQSNDYFILLRQDNWDEYQPKNKRFKKVLADYQWYSLKEQIFFPLALNKLELDLMHFTHFNVPFLYRKSFVVTIHDLILTKYPTERATTLGPLKYKFKHFGYQFIIGSAIRRAKNIIAVSKFTKQDIAEHFTVASKKISVTHEGVDPLIVDNQDTKEVLSYYGIETPYILYVGNVYPHKNIDGLVNAWEKVVTQKKDYKLVLVGKEDYFFEKIKELVKKKGLDDSIVFTGFVSDKDLPHIYKSATLYVFPSFCEGFGLPALEACYSSIPVVASDNSSLPEVLGRVAVYFDPKNIDQIAEKIIYIIDNPDIALELIKRGHDQVARFSWEKMARATLDLYEDN